MTVVLPFSFEKFTAFVARLSDTRFTWWMSDMENSKTGINTWLIFAFANWRFALVLLSSTTSHGLRHFLRIRFSFSSFLFSLRFYNRITEYTHLRSWLMLPNKGFTNNSTECVRLPIFIYWNSLKLEWYRSLHFKRFIVLLVVTQFDQNQNIRKQNEYHNETQCRV